MGKKAEKNCLKPRIPAAEALNVFTEQDYLERLSIIALSRFEWQNLPESMDQRYLEWCLFMLGQAAILKTKDYGFVNTKATTAGEINTLSIIEYLLDKGIMSELFKVEFLDVDMNEICKNCQKIINLKKRKILI